MSAQTDSASCNFDILDVCLGQLLPAHLELSISGLLLLLERDGRVVVEQKGDFLERETLGPEDECASVSERVSCGSFAGESTHSTK